MVALRGKKKTKRSAAPPGVRESEISQRSTGGILKPGGKVLIDHRSMLAMQAEEAEYTRYLKRKTENRPQSGVSSTSGRHDSAQKSPMWRDDETYSEMEGSGSECGACHVYDNIVNI